MEHKKDFQVGELLRKAFTALKKSWILIISIILLFTVAGVGYSYCVKPNYIAYHKTIYSAKFGPEAQANDYNISVLMIETFIDFCDEPVVLSRANYYYKTFVDGGKTIKDLDDFVKGLKTNDGYNGVYNGEEYIKASDVSVISFTDEENDVTNFMLSIGCKDKVAEVAKIKSQLLVSAIDAESSVEYTDGEEVDYKYFEAKVSLEDYGYSGTGTDVSKKKIILASFVLGVAVAGVVVFLMYAFDRRIRNREEVETITGTTVLAVIPNA